MTDIQLIGKDVATGRMVFLEAADAVVPTTDNDKDIGSSAKRFKNVYTVQIGDGGDARLQVGAIRISGPDTSGSSSWDQSYGTGDSTGLVGNAGDVTLAAGNCTNAGGNGNAGNARVAGGVASGSGTDGQVQIWTNGVKRWVFDPGGTLYPFAPKVYDIGGVANEIGSVYIADDEFIYLGSDQDATIGYDEATNDVLQVSCSAGILIPDDQLLYFGSNKDASLEYDENGDDKVQVLGTWNFSGATVEGLPFRRLATVASIDAKTVAATSLYTIPSGKNYIIVGAIVRCTAAVAITVGATAGIGIAAGEDDIFYPQVLTGILAAGDVWAFWASAKMVLAAGDEVVKFGIDTAATGTSQVFSVDLIGYEVP